jgi:hypothetical protein
MADPCLTTARLISLWGNTSAMVLGTTYLTSSCTLGPNYLTVISESQDQSLCSIGWSSSAPQTSALFIVSATTFTAKYEKKEEEEIDFDFCLIYIGGKEKIKHDSIHLIYIL